MDYIKPFGVTTPGRVPYQNGNPSAGVQGSIPDVAVWEYPMREILAVIEAASLTPSNSNLHQLLDAILALGASSTSTYIYTSQIGLLNPLPFVTTPGTYTYTPSSPKVRAVLVRGQAPGGGGGASSNCTSGQIAVGAPGGGGGYFEHYVVIANASTYTASFTVGTPGSGGTANAGSGGNGTPTSFAGVVTATGGNGGVGVSAFTTPSTFAGPSAAGGAATGGNIVNIPGGAAFSSIYLGNTAVAGQGGASQLGKSNFQYSATSPGYTGLGLGSGGTPGITQPGDPGRNGGAGGSGGIQFLEVF